MEITYQPVSFWPDAFHVYHDTRRVGIVNSRTFEEAGITRTQWFAHNKHFFSVGKGFATREAAAAMLDAKPIHHDSNALKALKS